MAYISFTTRANGEVCVFLLMCQDPSRNHRAYRLAVAKLSPPYIPFMPLLLKGSRNTLLETSCSRCSIQYLSTSLHGPTLSQYVVLFAIGSSRHDIHPRGKQELHWKTGQFWENGEFVEPKYQILTSALTQVISSLFCLVNYWLNKPPCLFTVSAHDCQDSEDRSRVQKHALR